MRHPDIVSELRAVFGQRSPNPDKPVHFAKTEGAKAYWDALYRKLNAQKRSGVIDNILARDTGHILKLALIFAIADRVDDIRIQHLEAALAVIDYCQNSARWIFGQATGNKLANNILWELRRSTGGGLTRTQINDEICHRNTPKTQLEKAFSDLVKNKLAKFTVEKGPNGQLIERWFATI